MLATDVVDVVGGHKRQAKFARKFNQRAVDFVQVGDVVALKFNEKALFAENIGIPSEFAAGGFKVAVADGARHLPRKATRGGDEAFGMLSKQISVNAGLVVKAVKLGNGGKFEQVLIADFVLRQ